MYVSRFQAKDKYLRQHGVTLADGERASLRFACALKIQRLEPVDPGHALPDDLGVNVVGAVIGFY